MDVIVIGGGIGGIATAYQLRAAGHRVCVIERHATVAQGATYGHGGAVLPSPLDVWFGPTFMGTRRANKTGILFKPGFDAATREFAKKLALLRDPEAFTAQYARLHPLVELSRQAIADIDGLFEFDYEQRTGLLHVFRHERELAQAAPAIELLRRFQVPHRVLTPKECVAAEPSVPDDPPFAGGVLLETERTANCPLFTKLLKHILEEGGVQFRLGREAASIRLDGERAAVELAPLAPAGTERKRSREVEVVAADAIVVAAGTGTPALLARVNRRLPLHPLRVHTLTAPIAYEEHAPHITVVDSVKRIAMTRVNQRLRVAGGAVLQSAAKAAKPLPGDLTRRALALLGQGTHDWIPGAAKVSAARPWDGVRLFSSDGLPVVGATSHARLFVNAAHGPAGWGLACGSAKVIADLVSGVTPDIPADTLAALSIDRF
ncbi:D-amino acid dehydrogenase small subunit [Caballeronia glathei]|uniref:Amino acid dehydrogenase n=1 Tax=Caballeronia glathei TaxID=60547 RepID=A0A069PL40_9BURK|nr:FAD-dependent oxidoreductase [Caballeronia glathei]KDR41345.1 amino acid dehydrogenase [Caballeronia glathei]CDY76520.1 D-amino acid dehydrogenase small subunit [Caballeronia glathei]